MRKFHRVFVNNDGTTFREDFIGACEAYVTRQDKSGDFSRRYIYATRAFCDPVKGDETHVYVETALR